jgi:hypothetical protein
MVFSSAGLRGWGVNDVMLRCGLARNVASISERVKQLVRLSAAISTITPTAMPPMVSTFWVRRRDRCARASVHARSGVRRAERGGRVGSAAGMKLELTRARRDWMCGPWINASQLE